MAASRAPSGASGRLGAGASVRFHFVYYVILCIFLCRYVEETETTKTPHRVKKTMCEFFLKRPRSLRTKINTSRHRVALRARRRKKHLIPDRIGLCVRASRPSQKTQTGTLAI